MIRKKGILLVVFSVGVAFFSYKLIISDSSPFRFVSIKNSELFPEREKHIFTGASIQEERSRENNTWKEKPGFQNPDGVYRNSTLLDKLSTDGGGGQSPTTPNVDRVNNGGRNDTSQKESSLVHLDQDDVDNATQIKTPSDQLNQLLNKASKTQILVYNRVPKCGSTSMIFVLRKFCKKYGRFTYKHSTDFTHEWTDTRGQAKMVKEVMELRGPALYEKQFMFVDFERFNSSTPIHINLIRDPLSRTESAYYFWFASGRSEYGKTMINKSLSECVEQALPACNGTSSWLLWKVVPYFCGHDDWCRVRSRAVLERAMQNVEKHYAVIGYLEDVTGFHQALEFVFPHFFKGLSEEYLANPLKANSGRKNRPTLSAKAEELLKAVMGLEYEFYRFIKMRFYMTHQQYLQQNSTAI